MRAAHTRLDPHPLINDPWGDRLVPESARIEIEDAALLRSRAYPNVITRTRYAEDALEAAVSRGIRQYVLIGAGFDSFALRRPAFSADLQIFEIDFPATQTLKIQRIKECGMSLPDSVHFIAADLSQESVAAALARSSFEPDRLTFFSWLGVTMYLTREANLATMDRSPPAHRRGANWYLPTSMRGCFKRGRNRFASWNSEWLPSANRSCRGLIPPRSRPRSRTAALIWLRTSTAPRPRQDMMETVRTASANRASRTLRWRA
jgi:methyltransferase (TIGR00027 family)